MAAVVCADDATGYRTVLQLLLQMTVLPVHVRGQGILLAKAFPAQPAVVWLVARVD